MQLEKRRQFKPEERKQILKRCNNKCVRCGMKLNLKTLTVEHVIPLSKGGKNEMENLVALCDSCNKHKRNFTMFAHNCYVGASKELLIQLDTYCIHYYKEHPELFDYTKYALLTPQFSVDMTKQMTQNNKMINLQQCIVDFDAVWGDKLVELKEKYAEHLSFFTDEFITIYHGKRRTSNIDVIDLIVSYNPEVEGLSLFVCGEMNAINKSYITSNILLKNLYKFALFNVKVDYVIVAFDDETTVYTYRSSKQPGFVFSTQLLTMNGPLKQKSAVVLELNNLEAHIPSGKT